MSSYPLHSKVRTILPKGCKSILAKVSHIGLYQFEIAANQTGRIVNILPGDYYYVAFVRATYVFHYAIHKQFLEPV